MSEARERNTSLSNKLFEWKQKVTDREEKDYQDKLQLEEKQGEKLIRIYKGAQSMWEGLKNGRQEKEKRARS